MPEGFRISNPRKGTETRLFDIIQIVPSPSFRISNPRKGTETNQAEITKQVIARFPNI